MKPHFRVCVAPLMLAVAIAGGCGKSEDKAAVATQVAAKVNSDEITVYQVNGILARENVSPEVAGQAKRQILERLIDQQLAKQQAIEKKLDRSPNTLQALEAAKNDILARSYLEQIAAAQSKPTTEEARKYYVEHPELFAQRRLFNLEEIAVQPMAGLGAQLKEQTSRARSLQEISEWLKSRQVKFTENRGVRAAEQIPLELLPKLQAMKSGEIQAIEGGGGLYVVRVVAAVNSPVDEATAIPRIQQFLFNQRSAAAIAAEIKQLRGKAKIEYAGEFAGAAPAAPAAAPAAATSPPPAKAEPPKADQPPALNLEKGIRGLR